MATISSAGIGSGLDVNNIVTQLVALEKQPLKILEIKATKVQSQMSAFGQIQSQFAALSDVVSRISAAGAWTGRTASSSNNSAATISALASAQATSFSLDVDALAQSQSVSSGTIAAGTAVGAGTLTLRLGTWSVGGAAFTPAAGSSDVAITISATDKVSDIAAKINAASSNVVATAFNDGTSDRLLIRSKATGVASGFRVQSGDAALQGLVFDPENKPGVGMAAGGIPVQYGQDARARINGLAVTSGTNTLSGNVPGITINLLATTTTSVSMAVKEDTSPAVKNVQDFVDAYNALNQTLTDMTKYDTGTQTAGLFQGDSVIVGLQNVLRGMLGSTSGSGVYQRLSDVGIQAQRDGSLTINTSKLSAAANNGTELQTLFTVDNKNPLTNGFGLKFGAFAKGVLASSGMLNNEAKALQHKLETYGKEQDRVNARAAAVEVRLRKQYSALDAQMGRLTALNQYVAQQVTNWNKSTG